MAPVRALIRSLAIALSVLATITLNPEASCAPAEPWLPWIKPEQRKICVRHPSQLPHVALPATPRPPTVTDLQEEEPAWNLSLDEAIRTALSNSEVIRVLAGVTAVPSGRTIYDVAIANANIDVAQGRFDPILSANNFWDRLETPGEFDADPGLPIDVMIGVDRRSTYDIDFLLSKTNLSGGTWEFAINDNTRRIAGPALLDPRNASSLNFSYTQPLLQGGGRLANQVPIVLARIDTERSYFQYKDSVQQLVRDVINAYWNLVTARTVLWARQQQVDQSQFAVNQAEQRAQVGDLSRGEGAQTRAALAGFQSTLIAAKADVLQTEAALRSIIGLPPSGLQRITPITPPAKERLPLDWDAIVSMAEEYRPDIIELKLILEADQQRLLQARNIALPRLDLVGLYRWNGLEGVMPSGMPVSSGVGKSQDWTLSINFSVPMGLRESRAQLRQQELIIARDRANLNQGLLTANHLLAINLRNLDQFFEQYEATRETRAASRENLRYQIGNYTTGLTQFINVLQAIVTWGDAVSAEAQLLSLYNSEQANLQLETGTILETHGVFFYEERYRSISPLGCFGATACYPRSKPPTDNTDLYPVGNEPAEESFDLTDPLEENRKLQQQNRDLLPPLKPLPPTEPFDPIDQARQLDLQQPSGVLPEPGGQ